MSFDIPKLCIINKNIPYSWCTFKGEKYLEDAFNFQKRKIGFYASMMDNLHDKCWNNYLNKRNCKKWEENFTFYIKEHPNDKKKGILGSKTYFRSCIMLLRNKTLLYISPFSIAICSFKNELHQVVLAPLIKKPCLCQHETASAHWVPLT